MERDSKELCIVLRTYDAGETSRLATLFSADEGAFDAMLYGAKKSAKAIKAPLFSEASFSLYRVRERNQCSVKDADFIAIRDNILSSLPATMVASLLAELVRTSRMSGAGLYALLASCLDELEFGQDPKRIAIYFVIRYLEIFGILSSLESCPVCQRIYARDEILGYSPKEQSLCCSLCDGYDGKLILPPNARAFLMRNLELPLEKALSLEISVNMIDRIYSFVLRYLRLAYPTRLKILESGMLETV